MFLFYASLAYWPVFSRYAEVHIIADLETAPSHKTLGEAPDVLNARG